MQSVVTHNRLKLNGVELALGCGGYFVCKKEDFTDLRGGASDFCLM